MSKRPPRLLIEDILGATAKIESYLSGFTYETFMDDSRTVDAVIRNFEIIGEAAKRLPEEFKDTHSIIEWPRIIGFRNKIVHDYMGVDFSIVWNISKDYLPRLKTDLNDILSTL